MTYPLKYGPNLGWDKVDIASFTGGFNSAVAPDSLEDNELIIASNVVLREGKVYGDTGYKLFGSAILGQPQATFQYSTRTGISTLLLVTTSSVYRLNPANNDWQLISSGVSGAATSTVSAGATSVNVSGISVMPASGDPIGISLTDGTQHKATVVAPLSLTTISFTPAVSAGKAGSIGTSVVIGSRLNGNAEHQVSIISWAPNDWVVFTNGIDKPKYYDGLIVSDIPNLPAGLDTCACVASFNAALFLLGTTESGLTLPQRIRRSDIGDPTNWTTNLSGYDDLYNGSDAILAAESLGPYLIVYKERSIIRGQFINTAGKIYSWDPMIVGEGVVSTSSVVNLDAEHLIFGNAGIFSYSGGYDLTPIGEKVFNKVFSERGDFNAEVKETVFSFYVEELGEAWFVYPSNVSELPNTIARYSTADGSWCFRDLPFGTLGYGFYQTLGATQWLDAVGSWAAQVGAWNSRLMAGGSPTTHICSEGDGVLEYDYVYSYDITDSIRYLIETKDFTNKHFSMRADELTAEIAGQDVSVEYSVDRGQSYHLLGTVTAISPEILRFNWQQVCDRIRFRFSSSQPGFMVGWVQFVYRNESSVRSV